MGLNFFTVTKRWNFFIITKGWNCANNHRWGETLSQYSQKGARTVSHKGVKCSLSQRGETLSLCEFLSLLVGLNLCHITYISLSDRVKFWHCHKTPCKIQSQRGRNSITITKGWISCHYKSQRESYIIIYVKLLYLFLHLMSHRGKTVTVTNEWISVSHKGYKPVTSGYDNHKIEHDLTN